jgi:WD40 repeat protein
MDNLTKRLQSMSSEKRLYALQNLIHHLMSAGQEERCYLLLTDLDFVEAKIRSSVKEESILLTRRTVYNGIFTLLEDYRAFIEAVQYSPEILDGEFGEGKKRCQELELLYESLKTESKNCSYWPMITYQQLRNAIEKHQPTTALLELTTKIESAIADRVWFKQKKTGYTRYRLNVGVSYGEEITNIRFVPNGKSIIATTSDKWILWNAETGQVLISVNLESKSGHIVDLALSPDGKLLALAYSNGECSLWTLPKGNLFSRWSLYSNKSDLFIGISIRISFSSDSNLLASIGKESLGGWVRVWNVFDHLKIAEKEFDWVGPLFERLPAVGTLSAVALGNLNQVQCISFLDDNKKVFSASDGELQVWDWTQDKIIWRFKRRLYSTLYPAFVGNMKYVALSEDGNLLLVRNENNTLHIWELSPEPMECLELVGKYSNIKACISHDGSIIAGICDDQVCYFWNTKDGNLVSKLAGFSSQPQMVDFSPDGNSLLVGTHRSGFVYDWSKIQQSYKHQIFSKDITSALFTSNGQRVIFTDYGTLFQIGFPLGEEYWQIKVAKRRILSIDWLSQQEMVACGGDDGICTIWHPPEKYLINRFSPGLGCITCIRFSHNGKVLAVGTGQGYCFLWRWNEIQTIIELAKFEGSITSLAFSYDDQLLVITSEGCECFIWDVVRNLKAGAKLGHTAWITCLAFSPDGSTLATGSFDRTVCLWNLYEENPIGVQMLHETAVSDVVFHPSGKALLSVDDEGISRLWSTCNQKLLTVFPMDVKVVRAGIFDNRIRLIAANGMLTEIHIMGIEKVINSVYGNDIQSPTRKSNPMLRAS